MQTGRTVMIWPIFSSEIQSQHEPALSGIIEVYMRKFLLTGFDAFDNMDSNPSMEVVAWLAHVNPELWSTAVLPTSFERSIAELDAAVQNDRPDVLVMFGYATGTSGVRLEQFATNLDQASRPDNDGVTRSGLIDPGKGSSLSTIFDLPQIAKSIETSGGKAWISNDAGGYVCNHAYFSALNRYREGLYPSTLFVHISDTSETTLKSARKLIELLE